MYYKSIYFDLPFLIFVKDGFKDKQLEEWAEAYTSGKDLPYSPYAPRGKGAGGLTIGGGFPVYIPATIESAYVVKIENKLMGVQFLRRITPNNPANLCGEIAGDRAGKASFSSVKVNFDLRMFESSFYFNTKYFVNLAVDAVNKFIEHYRVQTGKFYIRPITPAIVQSFTIFNEIRNQPTFHQHYITDASVLSVIDNEPTNIPPSKYHMDATMQGMGGAISDEIDQSLRNVLGTDEEPSIIDTLHLEVKDKLDLREWRLAAIEAAVLFETFLNTRLREVYRSKGLSESDIEDKFHKTDRFRTPLSSYAMAKVLVNGATGFDFSSTVEFQDWSTNTKNLRNNVVHGKVYKVSKQEATLSYQSVVDSIKLISPHM